MKSLRRGLWEGEIEKDSRGRFSCWVCGKSLATGTVAEDDETVRECPECGRAWKS